MAPKGVASPRNQHSPSTDSPRLVAAPARPRGQRPLPSRRRPGRAGPRPSGDDRVERARAAAERGAVPGAARAAQGRPGLGGREGAAGGGARRCAAQHGWLRGCGNRWPSCTRRRQTLAAAAAARSSRHPQPAEATARGGACGEAPLEWAGSVGAGGRGPRPDTPPMSVT